MWTSFSIAGLLLVLIFCIFELYINKLDTEECVRRFFKCYITLFFVTISFFIFVGKFLGEMM